MLQPPDDMVSRALHSELARSVAARPALRVSVRKMLSMSDAIRSLPPRLQQLVRSCAQDGDLRPFVEDSDDGRAVRAVSPLAEMVPIAKRDDAIARFVRASRRRAELAPHVEGALAALKCRGVRAEVIGSFAWGDFSESSDVDFLIFDSAGLTDGQVFETIAEHVSKVRFDIIHYGLMSDKSREYLEEQRRRFTCRVGPDSGGC